MQILKLFIVGLFTLATATAAFADDVATTADTDEAVKVELPEGWSLIADEIPALEVYANHSTKQVYFGLITEAKVDFDESFDLATWADLVKKNTAEAQREQLNNLKNTEIVSGEIGGHNTLEYEITGDLDGVKLRYRIIMLDMKGRYCKLSFWSTPSHWKDVQNESVKVVEGLN